MKLGACVNFLGRDTYSLHEELFPDLAQIFDHVELPVMTVAELDDGAFAHLCASVNDAQLPCTVMTNLFPPGLHLLAEEFDDGDLCRYLDHVLPRCAVLGCRALALGSGKARMLPPGRDVDWGYARLAALYQIHIAPRLREYGMALWLEPLGAALTNFIHTLGECAPLLSECAGMGILADSLHLMDRPETAQELCLCMNGIKHVHISEMGRCAPVASLSPPLKAFLQNLKSGGYSGDMSLECHLKTREEMIQCRDTVLNFWEQA